MSAKITDTFPVVKKADFVTKKYPKRKSKTEKKPKADQPQKVCPEVKDVEDLKTLRNFDLQYEFGPCIGISRLERWSRAQNYGLNPPAKVKEIIEEHASDDKFTQCVWHEEDMLY